VVSWKKNKLCSQPSSDICSKRCCD